MLLLAGFWSHPFARAESLPNIDAALAAQTDVWGDAALRQTNGPDYDFFARLLPPLRYVNAQFKYYPIVLSAPNAPGKPRLVSNGSAINPRANVRGSWHEAGTPVSFYIGNDSTAFGGDTNDLKEPAYLKGYLPVVQVHYRHDSREYIEETFAATTTNRSDHGVVFTRFSLTKGMPAEVEVEARIDTAVPLQWVDYSLRDPQGCVLFWCDKSWAWDGLKKSLSTTIDARRSAYLATATTPMSNSPPVILDAREYEREKNECVRTWEDILAKGTQVEVSEPRVNNAWKSLVIGALMLMDHDHMNYSAGNAYQCMYEAESGDITRALLMWGNAESRATMVPLLDYGLHPGLRFHDAAFKLQMLSHYYWLTRDRDFIMAQRPRWSKSVGLIITNLETNTGLLPREAYCGDQAQQVYSLNANANAWRGVRDMAGVLADMGETAEATRIASVAQSIRRSTLAAVEKSEFHETTPPFIPIALFGDEKPYPVLTASRMGSYWDLMIPYVLGSGIFDGNSEPETWMLRYLQEHGGLCMGMIRFDQHSGLFANAEGVDDLYTLRYAEILLQRDEPDRLLVSFYGKLAQGMTRNTFISAEGTSLRPLDALGRPMYLPPVGSGNGFFLWMLRGMLVQDHDSGNDGKSDTLRLLFATPRPWLEDGKTIRVENAPTTFGSVSLKVTSKLRSDKVSVEVDLPQRNPAEKTLLRLRLPLGWRIASANIGKNILPMEQEDVLNLSGLHGQQKILVKTQRITLATPSR